MQKIRQRYRYSAILLRELVRTDFKLRYQGSFLGYLWSLLRPLFMFVILYLVFVKVLRSTDGIPHAPVYLLLGIVLWNFFVEVTSGSVGAVVGKGDLLRKINFPKYVIILAVSLGALINLALNFIVIGFFMYLNHVVLTVNALVIIPLIIELYVLSLAVGLFLSALFVRFRDVSYIWDVVLQAGFYATPILYLPNRIPHEYLQVIILNPIAQVIQDARHVLVTGQSQTIAHVYSGRIVFWLIPIGLTTLLAVIAAAYFRSQSKNFAEEV